MAETKRRPIRDFIAKRLQNLIIQPRTLPSRAPDAYSVLAGEAGEYNQDHASTLAPVLGGIHLIARTAAASSWTIERYDTGKMDWVPVTMYGWPSWAHPSRGPHPSQTLPVAIETWILSRLIGSNSYIIPTRTLGGQAVEWFVPPSAYVYPWETGDYREPVQYTYSGVIFNQKQTDKGVRIEEIIHTPTLLINSQLIGTSAFVKAAPSFRAGIKADAHAEYVHESGGMQQGLLTVSERWGKSQQFDEFADRIGRELRNPTRRGAPIVAPGDLRAVPLYTTPQDSQLIDARSLTWSAASAILTIPPTLGGNPGVTTWGSGTRAQMDLFRAFTLSGHLAALNDTFSRLLPMNWRFRLTPEHLQWQADPLGAARFTTRLTGKIMTQNEARKVVGLAPVDDERADELEYAAPTDMPTMDDGDNGGDSDSARDDGDENETTERQNVEEDDDNNEEDTDMSAQFTFEASLLLAMDKDTEAEERDDMSIGGTAFVYGEVGYPTNGFGEQVAMMIEPGALSGADLSDIKLLIQHDRNRMIARGATGDVSVTLGDDGATWSAMLDKDDPQAVSMYRKVKRGTFRACSIGGTVIEAEERTDKVTGEDVVMVKELRLNEISVVPDGAFASADSTVFTAEEIAERFVVKAVPDDVVPEPVVTASETTEATAEVVEIKEIAVPDYVELLNPKGMLNG